MIPAIRSEVLRLRRRTFHLGLILFVAIAALGSLVALPNASDAPPDGPNPGGAFVTLADVAASDGFTSGLQFVGSLLGIVALAYWAISSAQDHSSGLIRLLVQAEPRRWPLLGGKVVALSAWTLVGTLLATISASAVALVVAGGLEVDTAAWTDAPVTAFLSSWIELSLPILTWGAIGLALAELTRSQAAAIPPRRHLSRVRMLAQLRGGDGGQGVVGLRTHREGPIGGIDGEPRARGCVREPC